MRRQIGGGLGGTFDVQSYQIISIYFVFYQRLQSLNIIEGICRMYYELLQKLKLIKAAQVLVTSHSIAAIDLSCSSAIPSLKPQKMTFVGLCNSKVNAYQINNCSLVSVYW